jgi:hypothetical protein
MGIAVARIGAEPLSVKCRICGRASPRGKKLCDQCVAAVKRARQVATITSQFLPQSGPSVASPPRPRAARSSFRRHAARWSWLPTKPGGWGVLITFTVFGAAVCANAYLAVQEIAERAVAVGMPAATEPSGARASVVPVAESLESERPAKRVESVDMPSSDNAPVIAESLDQTPSPEKPAPRRSVTANRIGRDAAARANPAASARVGEPEVTIAKAELAEIATTAAGIASAEIAPEPPVPDRWDTMSAALASCSRENFLAGVVCAERARLQYCEGFWGQVPQCRSATRPGTSR